MRRGTVTFSVVNVTTNPYTRKDALIVLLMRDL